MQTSAEFIAGFTKEAVFWGALGKGVATLAKSFGKTVAKRSPAAMQFAKPHLTLGMAQGKGVAGGIGNFSSGTTVPGAVGMGALAAGFRPAESQSFARSSLNKGLRRYG